MNNIIKCRHCGHSFGNDELEEDIIPVCDLKGNEYINYYCPFCGRKIKERKISNKYVFYHEWRGHNYLQLHDHHTLWDINCENLDWDEYEFIVSQAIRAMEEKHKNLKVYLLGRSGRHVCVEDTPVNRRRYQSLVNTAMEQEQWVIDWFNNKDKEVK